MTALSANITDAQTLIPVDAGLTNGTFQLPLYYTVDSEAIRVTGRAHRITWLVDRGIAGTTAASHSSAATLTRYYPEAAASGGGGGAIAVTDGTTTVNDVTTIEVAGATITEGSAGIAEMVVSVLSAGVTLTNVQIKALPTTQVIIVPAPGVGKMLLPFLMHLRCSAAANYTNIHASCVLEFNNGSACGILDQTITSSVSALLAPGDPADAAHAFISLNQMQRSTTMLNGISGFYDSDLENLALSLKVTNAAGDFTGGDAANTLRAIVYYAVVDL